MTKSAASPAVDAYIAKAKQWPQETAHLRALLLDCGLAEEFKWGKPCYAFEGGNVVIIQGFKAYCALLFFKGALLEDPQGILVKTGENTRVGRQIRFNSVQEITGREAVLKAYVRQAIAVEQSGLEVDTESEPVPMPDELRRKLADNPALKTAFSALTPGRQRGYLFYFSGAKQAKTREARIDKCAPRIYEGKGLNNQ